MIELILAVDDMIFSVKYEFQTLMIRDCNYKTHVIAISPKHENHLMFCV